MLNRTSALTVIGVVSAVHHASGAPVRLTSPDRQIQITVSDVGGQIKFSVAAGDRPLVSPSRMGFEFGGPEATGGLERAQWRIAGNRAGSTDEVWSPVFGKRSRIRNHFNELAVTVEADHATRMTMKVVFRAYDDGVAFRYHIGLPPTELRKAAIKREGTEIGFADDMEWWSYRRERAPAGPARASKIKGKVQYPLLARSPSGKSVAVLEAHLRDFAWAELASREGEAGFHFEASGPADVPLPFLTPWRVIMIGDSPGELIDSDLIVNLNPRAKKEDYAWLKPGIAFWDWRAWGYRAGDGFKYDLDLASWKRFIDFASETGVAYLLIDANWYGNEFSPGSDPITGGKSQDVKAAIEYGKQKGVGLILYLNHVAAMKYGIEKIIPAYAEWGARGIKYGFMRMGGRQKVQWTHKVAELCGRHGLIVNFHDGPVPPTGEEAYIPSLVHREFCHAQSDARRAFSPSDFVKMVHVNMLAGPIDMNNGMFDLVNSKEQRPKVFRQINSTILAEAARTLITYGGGVTVIPDAADSYRKHPELFRFISEQKLPWTESRTLDSQMGRHISMMRRTGDTYLVGSVTDESERDLVIDLSFLPPGRTFRATVFSDKPDSHYLRNRMAYEVSRRQVMSGQKVNVHIAPGSGHCMIIEPQ